MEPMCVNYQSKSYVTLKCDNSMVIDNLEKLKQQKVPNEEKINDMLKEYDLSKTSNSMSKQKLELNKQIFFEVFKMFLFI